MRRRSRLLLVCRDRDWPSSRCWRCRPRAERSQSGNLIVSLDGGISPRKLPATRTGPGRGPSRRRRPHLGRLADPARQLAQARTRLARAALHARAFRSARRCGCAASTAARRSPPAAARWSGSGQLYAKIFVPEPGAVRRSARICSPSTARPRSGGRPSWSTPTPPTRPSRSSSRSPSTARRAPSARFS